MKKTATAKEFVRVWQISSSLEEVAEELGMTLQACSSRASHYRSRGVPLKKMSPARERYVDWHELADFARKFLDEDDANEL